MKQLTFVVFRLPHCRRELHMHTLTQRLRPQDGRPPPPQSKETDELPARGPQGRLRVPSVRGGKAGNVRGPPQCVGVRQPLSAAAVSSSLCHTGAYSGAPGDSPPLRPSPSAGQCLHSSPCGAFTQTALPFQGAQCLSPPHPSRGPTLPSLEPPTL